METCVLIPQELSLAIIPSDRERDRNKQSKEINVTVFSNVCVPQGTFLYPFQGTIRLDKIEVTSYLDDNDIRHRYGCYDEISITKCRHCNWVRFLRASPTYSEDVNVIGTRVKGEPIFEVVKNIPANTELVAFFLPERQEEVFFMPAVNYLRNSLYRRTMDTILEDSPLDLSTSLLSRVMIPSPGSTSSSPPSFGGDTDERKSPITSSETSSNAGDMVENLRHSTHSQVLNEALNLRHSGSEVFNDVDNWKSRQSFHSRSSVFGSGDVMLGRQQKIRSQRGERNLLPCEVCGKAFDRPSLLKRHMRTHTGEKPHVCMVCNKGFSTSSSLNTHRRIHSGEKPHQCQVCGKRFTASSNLYYHRMTHIKEKPHKCTLCAKSFPTPGDLKSHMYVHNGSWPFKCHICNRGFSKHTNLKNHLFLHTGDKPHSCELCHKKFALACNLRAHMKTHEGDPQEECVRCGKVYLLSSNQISHGFCSSCYAANQGLPLIKESENQSYHDSGSEDSNPQEEEEEEEEEVE